jgi:hypothetical protein
MSKEAWIMSNVATVRKEVASTNVASFRNEISSINVVERFPQLRIDLSKTDAGAPTIVVDGMPAAVAFEIPWTKVIDFVIGIFNDRGSVGGGGDGCTTAKVTNPDGSTVEIKTCPAPPKPA